MSIEAMKLALEAFQCDASYSAVAMQKRMDAITAIYQAIKQAIEQAEKQEPVAWMASDNKDIVYASEFDGQPGIRFDLPLYTAPPKREWVGLTDEEIRDVHWSKPMDEYSFAAAIEAKLKEKNT